MNPQPPISILCFEVIRDIFSNLDRKTLCLMQIVCKRFNLIIEKEFNGTPPYLILHKLMDGSWLNGSYEQIMWSVQIEDNSSVRKTLPTLNKLAKCKFIRFKETYFFFYHNDSFTPMDILPISHVWENGFLKVNWEDLKEFRPADEFYRAFTKCSELYLEGTNATCTHVWIWENGMGFVMGLWLRTYGSIL
ncbi:f-box domain-containing protein [Ditylenchus destructor]|nr:f-box domain-containing protein [Ditylenchus destructor]